jgi:hypothetical protein
MSSVKFVLIGSCGFNYSSTNVDTFVNWIANYMSSWSVETSSNPLPPFISLVASNYTFGGSPLGPT